MNEGKDVKETKEEKITFAPKSGRKERSHEDYFKGGMLLLVAVIIAISAFQLYFIINDVIYTWFKSQYVPIIRAFYNLAVIIIGLWVLKGYILKKEKN